MGMRRNVFTADHEVFRAVVRAVVRDFVAKEVVPHFPSWEAAGQLPREVFAKLGVVGATGTAIPGEDGGAGAGLPVRRRPPRGGGT
jgi:acyl-CoA dehydrogenase